MKTKFTLLSLFVAFALATSAQQIPNAGFETWTNPLTPDDWATIESIFNGQVTGLSSKDTADKVEGTASLKLVTDSVQAGPNKLLLSGLASLGTGLYSGGSIEFFGVPFPYRPDTLFFSYKYTSPGSDTAAVQLFMSEAGTPVLAGAVPLSLVSTWVNIYVPLTAVYTSANTPDTLIMQFFSSLGNGLQGSTLNVDDVSFGYVSLPSALQEIADQLNVVVYPNPASDLLTVSTDVNAIGFRMMVTDVNGKVVSSTNLNNQKTTINLSEFANGTYIYRITDKTGNILKQNRFNVVK